MIERIDHLVAVVEDFDAARRLWLAAGCPAVWDGTIRQHRSCCVSLGPINLELLSREVFQGWPGLSRWADWTARQFGLHAAALDPGDLDATLAELRSRGFEPSEPREGALRPAPGGAAPAAPRWRNSIVGSLPELLPGLPAFLCQFVAPTRSLGRAEPDSPLRFLELRVGVADLDGAAATYARALGADTRKEGAEMTIPLGDTPIRLVPGAGWAAVLEPRQTGLPLAELEASVPGVVWRAAPA